LFVHASIEQEARMNIRYGVELSQTDLKYVVRLSAEERAELDGLIRKGKRSADEGPHPLKANVSEVGEG
jgi:hypothetical protein